MPKLILCISALFILAIAVFTTVISAQAKQEDPALSAPSSVSLGTLHKEASAAQSMPAIETDNILPADFSPTTIPPQPTLPATSALDDFASSLKNQQAGRVVGVYVPAVLALRVAQQPTNNLAYVDTTRGYATQFGLAAQYGTTGFLAHNYLSGGLFFKLAVGEEVDVIYGDGIIDYYKIVSIRHFQALNPTSPASNFVDLDAHNNLQISNADLFNQIYNQGNQVVFQTCIDANGNSSWGRLFVIAKPIP